MNILRTFHIYPYLAMVQYAITNNNNKQITVESARSAMANALNWDIELNEFQLQSRYYIQFWTNTLGRV